MRVGISQWTLARFWLLSATFALYAAAAGCGLRTPDTERLDRTRRLQEHLEQLDRELVERPWQNSGFRLRVPRQFAMLPEESQPTTPVRDETLPGGLRRFVRELNGVQAVWRTAVHVRGKRERWPAYLVLASNRNLTEGGSHTLKDAQQFEERMIEAMFHDCGQTRPLRSDWTSRRLPTGREFAVTRNYTVFQVSAGAAAVEGEPYRLLAYCANDGPRQFALLFLLPENVADDEKLTEDQRIGLCLGTLAELSN